MEYRIPEYDLRKYETSAFSYFNDIGMPSLAMCEDLSLICKKEDRTACWMSKLKEAIRDECYKRNYFKWVYTFFMKYYSTSDLDRYEYVRLENDDLEITKKHKSEFRKAIPIEQIKNDLQDKFEVLDEAELDEAIRLSLDGKIQNNEHKSYCILCDRQFIETVNSPHICEECIARRNEELSFLEKLGQN